MRKTGFTSFVALAQGVYYLLTGVWPIVSRSSFEKITGPKVDFWLVRAVFLNPHPLSPAPASMLEYTSRHGAAH